MTKEWVRLILNGDKKLVKLADLKPVNVGNHEECSVKALYKEFSERPNLKPYMPPKLYKGRQLDKTYFFNIINTFCGEELEAILRHAHKLRNSVEEEE